MAPGVHDGIVYVSTVPADATEFYERRGVGVLWALDAKTGKKLWHFDTVPDRPLGGEAPTINSGGGLWYAPSFDGKGSMYFGIGNPAPFPGTGKYPWGSSRPGPNLYTDSIVKLNAKTGKMDWYYQLTPHDIYDWDFQDPPILTKVGGRELAIGGGQVGDRRRPRRADRQAGLEDARSAPTTATTTTACYAMRREYSKLKTPVKVFPGNLGGVIAPMATDGTGVFVPVVNHSVTIASPSEVEEESPLTGELVALDAQTGAIEWKHGFSSAAFGATGCGQRRRLHHHLRRQRVRASTPRAAGEALAGNAAGRQQHRPHRLRRHRDRPRRPRGRRRPDAGDGRLPPRRLRRG